MREKYNKKSKGKIQKAKVSPTQILQGKIWVEKKVKFKRENTRKYNGITIKHKRNTIKI
jgi:hypothetical protein